MLNMTRDFQMKTMRRPLVLKSVLFDLGKSDLRIEGKAELDSLASLLNKDWPNVVIELRSHTDLRGSDILNEKLSLARAQSCVDYLVEQGGKTWKDVKLKCVFVFNFLSTFVATRNTFFLLWF